MKSFKVGDILVCKNPKATNYVYTRGEDYVGVVTERRDDDEEDIKLESLVETRLIQKGRAYWVSSKYFKLKNDIIEKAEDF